MGFGPVVASTISDMRFVVVSSDPEIVAAAKEGFHPNDEALFFQNWREALEKAAGADLMFIDLLSTLTEAHKIQGYEDFAQAKMSHPTAAAVPLVLINAPDEYDLDSMVGWPDFLFGNLRRPVTSKVIRRMTTYV
ncbi:MAG: hypothetical protein QOJ65_2687 [Fimbriimonadaceae bacterium]|jgi:hypothetical protein|nr:hypothetical protein [Fimbriimonadaceae bacterium]